MAQRPPVLVGFLIHSGVAKPGGGMGESQTNSLLHSWVMGPREEAGLLSCWATWEGEHDGQKTGVRGRSRWQLHWFFSRKANSGHKGNLGLAT